MRHLSNIYWLGTKELRTLWRDKVMMFLIIYSFSFGIYIGATATSMEIHNASIAFVDQDRSTLSGRLVNAFYKPRFNTPTLISAAEMDASMDAGVYTFVVTIPSDFEKDVVASRQPELQVNIDATRMTQAGIGAGYIQQMLTDVITTFAQDKPIVQTIPIELVTRFKYNPNLTSSWFGSIMEIINNTAMISIILSGAALIREREHGTLEHLLVMPLNAAEIMLSKIWSTAFIILISVAFSLYIVVEIILSIPIAGSIPLFLFGSLLLLFSTTSLGILMGTIARTMPQLGLIFILTVLPLQILSGSVTPFESMPDILQYIMKFVPTSHFVEMAQAILYRGAGIDIIWPNLIAILIIGCVNFYLSYLLFRKHLN